MLRRDFLSASSAVFGFSAEDVDSVVPLSEARSILDFGAKRDDKTRIILRRFKAPFSAAFCGLLLISCVLPCAAQRLRRNSKGDLKIANAELRAEMKADGSYSITVAATGWNLQGKLPRAAMNLRSTSGVDRVGRYRQLATVWDNGTRIAEIRVYDRKPLALFRDVWAKAAANETPFPSFQSLPSKTFRLSFKKMKFSFYEFGKLGSQGPWSFFDKASHEMILSPADHFQVAAMDETTGGGADSRIVPEITTLPAGFVHGTLIAAGTGINNTFVAWGAALLRYGGKQRSANDGNVTLKKLGYWTDNRTTYYYKFDPKLGYTGTLLEVRDEFQKLGLPLGYMQLDSWFYPKGPDGSWNEGGGEMAYRADKTLFPQGLDAFHRALGLPLMTHARWVAPQSPYRNEFRMSGNVVIDPLFWKETAKYLHEAGVVTYEQDWLNENAQTAVNLTDPPAFFGDMAKHMAADNITIQYCMPLPSDYMASTLYSNVRTIRTSDDGFMRARWDTFLYDSRLASALGLWPWTDAFFSKDLSDLIVSTLSAGPVGVGDALGETNVANLKSAIRGDGVIVKPDTPLLPIDETYVHDAQDEQSPMVAAASTTSGKSQVLYVFAYPRRPSDTEVTVPLKDLGLSQGVYAWNWVEHRGELIPPGGSVRMKFVDGWAYEVLCPIAPNGLTLVGDTEQIVPLGKARIAVLSDDYGLSFTVHFAANESARRIVGYASRRPGVRSVSGKVNLVEYNPRTNLFQLEVWPGPSGQTVVQIHAR